MYPEKYLYVHSERSKIQIRPFNRAFFMYLSTSLHPAKRTSAAFHLAHVKRVREESADERN